MLSVWSYLTYRWPLAQLTIFILLAKLGAMGLSNDIVRWFKSYLSGRQQLVDVAGTFFHVQILHLVFLIGPLFFNICEWHVWCYWK